MGAQRLYGDSLLTDVEFDDVVVASQRLEELLEILAERPMGRCAAGGAGGDGGGGGGLQPCPGSSVINQEAQLKLTETRGGNA